MGGAYSTHGEMRNAYKNVEELEEKTSRGRSRRRWEDNIKMNVGKWCWRLWVEFMWLRIVTSGGL
jgi:hypothetical protein